MNQSLQTTGVHCLWLWVCCLVFLGGAQCDAQTITTGSLFEEMIDMERLARFPEPSFKTIQFSSHDRRSTVPGGPDWFANSDGFGREPIPNFEAVLKAPNAEGVGEYLVADVEGPGAIVRVWTAAIGGEIRMTLDGAETPIFKDRADRFFHRPYDHFETAKTLEKERFDRTVIQRDASYAPIPFAKRLRVVWTGNIQQIHFYELQVRLYDKDASVQTFSPADIETYKETINRVTAELGNPDQTSTAEPSQTFNSFNLNLAPDQTETAVRLEGTQAIQELRLHVTAKDLDKALRQTVLLITCDDYPWGQVQSPVGDFFGAAPGVNPYQSMPFTVRADGTMICRYVMPFESSCRVELFNGGEQPVAIKGSVFAVPCDWTDQSMHFRARWRVDHNITGSNRAVQDLPFLLAHGKGVYVGTGVYLMNPSPVPTPYGNWWGEGDEKIFVDDDVKPSTFGTGSEDYFNYSWSSPDIFLFPYCGQPRNDGPGNRGFVTNYRWHILDSLPFQDRMRFYMELYSHERTPGMSYARIAYHYARPGLTDDHQAIMPDDLHVPSMPKNWEPAARMGARNSVFFASEEIVSDKAETRLDQGALWAGDGVLVWTPKTVGDKKTFTFSVKSTGNKQVNVTMAMTPRGGTVALSVDGTPLREVDLHRSFRTLHRNVALKPLELTQGDHTLTVELKAFPEGAQETDIGIDMIWIQDK